MKKFIVIIALMLIAIPVNNYASERVSLGYIYSSSKTHSEIIDNTNNSINVVSPTCFDINDKGRLEINGLMEQAFIDEMHEKNIKVTPFLSNHWERKRAHKALDNPERLVDDITNAIIEYNLDGLNVDFENISVDYKEKLTNFVKLLREALPEDKIISVAVAANPKRLEKTWLASYDYKALSEYADYLVVMTYDEHCAGGTEGPVASIDFVRNSIEYVLESVSKDKIILGIPLYGRLWKVGEETGGEAIVIGQVENLIKKYNLVPIFDEKAMSPKLTIDIDEIIVNAYVNGKYLREGTYNIWYENEHSIKTKLKLVNEYNLLGTALWALDNEGKEFWDYYKEALNETKYESEKEIRIKQRAEAYKKIIKVKSLIVNIKSYYEKEEINLPENILPKIEELEESKYDILEAIIVNDVVKFVKSEKIIIRSFSKWKRGRFSFPLLLI